MIFLFESWFDSKSSYEAVMDVGDDIIGMKKSLSERAPQESGSLRYRLTFTPHDPPVLYAPDGRDVSSVPITSIPGRPLFLYERLTTRKLS